MIIFSALAFGIAGFITVFAVSATATRNLFVAMRSLLIACFAYVPLYLRYPGQSDEMVTMWPFVLTSIVFAFLQILVFANVVLHADENPAADTDSGGTRIDASTVDNAADSIAKQLNTRPRRQHWAQG